MKATVRKMTRGQLDELRILDDEMDAIQAELDDHYVELVVAEKNVNIIREKIKAIKPRLVPLAEAKVSVVKKHD